MPIEELESLGSSEEFRLVCDVCGEEAEGDSLYLAEMGWAWTELELNGTEFSVALCRRDGDHEGKMWELLEERKEEIEEGGPR